MVLFHCYSYALLLDTKLFLSSFYFLISMATNKAIMANNKIATITMPPTIKSSWLYPLSIDRTISEVVTVDGTVGLFPVVGAAVAVFVVVFVSTTGASSVSSSSSRATTFSSSATLSSASLLLTGAVAFGQAVTVMGTRTRSLCSSLS